MLLEDRVNIIEYTYTLTPNNLII